MISTLTTPTQTFRGNLRGPIQGSSISSTKLFLIRTTPRCCKTSRRESTGKSQISWIGTKLSTLVNFPLLRILQFPPQQRSEGSSRFQGPSQVIFFTRNPSHRLRLEGHQQGHPSQDPGPMRILLELRHCGYLRIPVADS